MKRITVPIGVGLIHLYRIVFFWLPFVKICRPSLRVG